MKRIEAPILLLALSAFLAPLVGGYIDVASAAGSPGILDIFGYDACTLAHGLLYALVAAAVALAIVRRQVAQLPHTPVIAALGCLLAFITLSLGLSQYKMQSLISFADWLMYGVAFMASAAIVGRKEGPKLLCGAFVAGCIVTSLGAMREYVTQPDPAWRVMFHWENPNALAGILVLGLFTAIGLGYASSKPVAVVWCFAGGILGSTLLLTQSKGGLGGVLAGLVFYFLLLAYYRRSSVGLKAFLFFILDLVAIALLLKVLGFAIGIAGLKGVLLGAFALLVFLGAYTKSKVGVKVLYLAAPFVLALIIFVGLTKIQKTVGTDPGPTAAPVAQASGDPATPLAPTGGPAPLGRVLNPMSTAEQSASFRFNLWKGCLTLIKDNVIGDGIGTYRFQSAKPGNTSETKLAHNSFLQLAVEAGPLASISLIVFLALCAFEMVKGSRKLPEKPNLFRAGLFAAILAAVVHNCVDSDLYFTGTGLSFFLLIGVGLALSSDAIVPELLRPGSKAGLLGAAAVGSLVVLYAGVVQIKIENLLSDIATRSPNAPAEATALQGLCPFDWRVWYYSVPMAQNPEDRVNLAQKSVEQGPTVVAYHRLAIVLREANRPTEAIGELNASLKLDPNNLAALQLMLDIQKETSVADAVKTAERMIGVEKTTYFSIRALPEVVPTETYEARIFLATQEKDPAKLITLLRPAVQGLTEYANTTVPMIVRFESTGGSQVGSPKDAVNILSDAITAARALAKCYRMEKDENDAKWADNADRTFEAALPGLATPPSLSK